METQHRSTDAGERATDKLAESVVTVHSTCEDRVVFTERDNTDGWIATDAAVDLRR